MKKLSAFLLSLVLCFNLFSFGVFAAENTSQEIIYYSSDIHISDKDMEYLKKVVSVGKFYYIENNELKISLTKDELIGSYGFSEEEYFLLVNSVIGTHISEEATEIQPYVFIEDGALYITHEDLSAGVFAVLVTAASAGPAAIAAALTSISTILGGPVGTFIGGLLSALSAPSLLELGVKVTQAVATGQGLYIKPVLSYPPFEFGFWG